MSRSQIVALVFVAVLAGLWFGRALWWPAPALVFTERASPAGFRDLGGGPVSAGLGALGPLPGDAAPVPGDLCRALFHDAEDPRIGAGPVAAVFLTDYRCPYCRVLGEVLLAEADAGRITLIVKEWAALGPASVAAARLALAADRQGAFRSVHERLKRSAFVPTPAYVEAVAADLGLDPARLAADAASTEIEAQIARAAALARALGFPGTPGLVVGRSVVSGAIDRATLAALIDDEAAGGGAPC
jgi:protein-disulfide isomerase